MKVPGVTWSQLSLSGFGRYRSTVIVDLSSGLSVLVGPNEIGKTTLIDGLVAVLFGLPANQDPTQFGQSKWRNWQNPTRFAGELLFTVDEEEWQLQRDFATNRISLRQRIGGSWREAAEGVDNPAARRPFSGYHDQLRHLIGVDRRDLFQFTCCLTQPLPAPEGLDQAVQALLTGAGSRVDKVQEYLELQVKSITRYYGESLGVGRGGNKDRRLEEVQAEIRQLEQAIVSGESTAAGLQSVQQQLARLDEQRQDLALQLQIAEQLSGAWVTWRSYQERYQRQLAEQQKLLPALEKAKGLQARQAELMGDLEPYGDMTALDARWPECLERLRSLEAELTDKRHQLQRTEQAIALLKTEQTELQGKQQAYLAERDNPMLVANDVRCQALSQTIVDLKRRLQTEYSLFESASQEQMAQIAEHRHRSLELTTRQHEAERAYGALWEREQAYNTAEAKWSQRFGPLRDAERLLDAVNRSMRSLGTQRSAQPAASARGGLLPWGAALLLSLIVFGLWGRQNGSVGLGASLFAGVAAFVLLRLARPERKRPTADFDRSELGPLAALTWEELLSARSLLESLIQARLGRPRTEQLSLAKGIQQEAVADLTAWQRDMQPFAAAFPDLGAAYQQWAGLRQALRTAERDLVAVSSGIKLGVSRETEQRLALVASELAQREQERQTLRAAQQLLERAWDGELQSIAATWRQTGNMDALGARYQAYQRLRAGAEAAAQALQELLAVFQVSTLAGLERQSLDLGNSIALSQLSWQQLLERNPGLPGIHQADQAEKVQELFLASEARLTNLRQATEAAREQQEQLWRQQATLLGQEPCNLAQAEEQLQQLTLERDRLQLEVAAVGLAYRELGATKRDYELNYRERLAMAASRYFDRITGGQGRRVALGHDFQVTVLTEDGKAVLPAQLSQGARDQLYFSLRLAIADLLVDQIKLPFILDDPFVNSDAERLERIRQALQVVAGERQICLFTHQQQFGAWGTPILLQLTD